MKMDVYKRLSTFCYVNINCVVDPMFWCKIFVINPQYAQSLIIVKIAQLQLKFTVKRFMIFFLLYMI